MDYFNDVLTTFLGLELNCIAVSGLIKNAFICVPKMNEGITCLEQCEGE